MITVGIIGAMEEEGEYLREKIEHTEEYTRGGNTFYIGSLHGAQVILLKCGIGKVNAAIGTTQMITRYDPMCLINTGSAGGLKANMEVGDVIISSHVIHHDVDVTAFGYEYGQIPQLPFAFLPHRELVRIAGKAARKLKGLRIHQGMIATGDSFMDDPEKIRVLKEKLPEAAAAEMEAAAVAQVCHQFRKPFVIIRSLSDIAGKESATSFQEFIGQAAEHSARMVLEIIGELTVYAEDKERKRIREALWQAEE